jgi:hypothetical protein
MLKTIGLKGKNVSDKKCVLYFPLQFLFETFIPLLNISGTRMEKQTYREFG